MAVVVGVGFVVVLVVSLSSCSWGWLLLLLLLAIVVVAGASVLFCPLQLLSLELGMLLLGALVIAKSNSLLTSISFGQRPICQQNFSTPQRSLD